MAKKLSRLETEVTAMSANFVFKCVLMAVKTCSKANLTVALGHGKSPCFLEAAFLRVVDHDG